MQPDTMGAPSQAPEESLTTLLPHWRPALSVGNAKLDEQHIILLEMGRNLLDDLGDPAHPLERLILDVEDLLAEAREHDAQEEHILAVNRCPSLEAHRQSHWLSRQHLAELLDRMRAGDVDAQALSQAVHGWMQHHIGEFDLPVKHYMKSPAH